MATIDEMLQAYGELKNADGNRWPIHPVLDRRIYIGRGPNGEHAVFIEGDRSSFGNLPPVVGIQHSSDVLALPSERPLAALRLQHSDAEHGGALMAHVAYELQRRLALDPNLDNEALLSVIGWMFPLLGQVHMMPTERQRGLIGECILLRTLLLLGRGTELPPVQVLERWWGHDHSKRDFAAEGLAIEVKTTSMNVRQHHVGSMQQLEPQAPGEAVYLYSIGLKSDPTAPKKLPHFVADVEALLVHPDGRPDIQSRKTFSAQLRTYGYLTEHSSIYLTAPGYLKPHLEPALFDQAELDIVRSRSFVNNTIPRMVVAISYVMEPRSEPLNPSETDDLLRVFLKRPVLGRQSDY